jgi:hypothetical protein
LVASLVLGAAGAAHAGGATIKSCGTTITAPGSYRVSANLTVPSGGSDCIRIASHYVTLDLGGFTVDCAGEEVNGITDGTVNYRGVVIRNGRVTRCSRAIFLGSRAVVIDHVQAFGNLSGIYVGNSGGLVIDSISNDNVGAQFFVEDGIFMSCPSLAVGNTALGNDFKNIRTDQAGCVLVDNLAP